jgi:Icc-related predicted phosphoesterase
VPVERIDAARVAALVPGLETADVLGGVHCAEDGTAIPGDVTRELAGRAAALGVDVREQIDALVLDRDVLVVACGPSSAQVAELEKDPQKVQTLFTEQMCKTVERWMQMAEEKFKDSKVPIYVAPGNDDEMEIDEVIAGAKRVVLAEGRTIDIGGYEMISSGWANPTPWHTYREAPEEELLKRMEPMIRDVKDMSRAIFNFHPPPFGTSLDEAPALDENLKPLHGGRALRHVGSTAVREAIDKHQPMLSLHGHIHEGKGITRIGKTLAINPGSAYEEGLLLASIIELDQKKGIKNYQLVNG